MLSLKTKNRRKSNVFAFTPVFKWLFLNQKYHLNHHSFLDNETEIIKLRIACHFFSVNDVINLNNYL